MYLYVYVLYCFSCSFKVSKFETILGFVYKSKGGKLEVNLKRVNIETSFCKLVDTRTIYVYIYLYIYFCIYIYIYIYGSISGGPQHRGDISASVRQCNRARNLHVYA
jgi:hypothetical protein